MGRGQHLGNFCLQRFYVIRLLIDRLLVSGDLCFDGGELEREIGEVLLLFLDNGVRGIQLIE